MDQQLPEIIFEDKYLLAINKPAGLLSIRDGYNTFSPYVTKLFEPYYGKLWIVHRLDRDTSGIMILARDRESHRLLNIDFENRKIQKIYHAIVNGIPLWKDHLVDVPLKVNGDRHHRTTADSRLGKPAQTKLKILRTTENFSLLEAIPLSGYTHQIRAHLFSLGISILADPLYIPHPLKSNPQNSAPNSILPPISRLALHACSIIFQHPITNTNLTLVAPYPEDFKSAIQKLSLSE